MSRKSLARNQQGAVSVLFAGAAVPLVGLIGLSIDFAVLTQARTTMALAADTAALSSVKIASNDFATSGDSDHATSAGKTNALQWFAAQVGGASGKNVAYTTLRGGAQVNTPTVSVQRNGVTFTTQLNYTGKVPTTFSGLFGITSFNISGSASASISLSAYVNIALMLDNSSSMLIGATTNDINTLQTLTPCSPESTHSNQGTGSWTGPWPQATCPTSYTTTSGGTPPVAGAAPKQAACGFACHWSNNNQTKSGPMVNGKASTVPDYTQYDYYALARDPTIGAITGYTAPTLRFDTVQSASATLVQTMETSNVVPNQFGLSVFTFNTSLTKVYPSSGEASTDLASGLTAVQAITTPVVSNDGDTDFPDSMTTLSTTLTKAGDGSSTATPKKALFIVTDGIQDYGSRSLGNSGSATFGPWGSTAAVNACTTIKNMGISIYILYTPYTPLPYNPFYVSNLATYVNTPPTPNAIVTALQNCASSASDVYEADLPSQITSGLQTLLKAASATPARISS